MGNIVFVSELCTGSMSDVTITEKSGFYKLLHQLMVAGYLPSFVKSGTQMSQSDVDITQTISAHRIQVERAIRKIRTFKIASHCIPTSIFGSINKVRKVCALLTL